MMCAQSLSMLRLLRCGTGAAGGRIAPNISLVAQKHPAEKRREIQIHRSVTTRGCDEVRPVVTIHLIAERISQGRTILPLSLPPPRVSVRLSIRVRAATSCALVFAGSTGRLIDVHFEM